MRSPFDDFSVMSDNGGEQIKANINNTNNSAIPYHARENSLPFSYGQINKTSTPLRSVKANNGSNSVLDYDYNSKMSTPSPSKTDVVNFGLNTDHYYGTNYNKNANNNNNNNGLTATLKSTTTVGSGTDKSNNTIKAQPRLTSPILVRKTLNSSRSPTRNGSTNTNTIANTYHYKYGSSDNDDNIFAADFGGRSSIDRNNTLNGNISNSYNTNGYGNTTINNNNYNSKMYSNNFGVVGAVGDTIDGSMNVRKTTQPRDDFEKLLRERREKVMREHYRSAGSQPITTNGSGGVGSGGGSGAIRSLSPNSQKYNYDFEFHLNLDEAPQPPQRSHTMDRMQYEYRTRDIPVAREVVTPTNANNTTTYVERNYHTINSSNANREVNGGGDSYPNTTTTTETTQQQFRPQKLSPQQPHQPRQRHQQQFESLYSTVEKRTIQPSQRQYSPSLSPSPTQYHQRRLEYTTYGNGNASGYGYDSNSNNEYTTTNNRSSLGAAVVARSRNDLSSSSSTSPIYATTSKHVTNKTTTYGNRNIYEPELSITDHPYGLNATMSLPIGSTSNAAGSGDKISPSSSSNSHTQAHSQSHVTITRPETPAFPATPHTTHSGGSYSGQNSPMGYSHSPLPPQQRSDLPNGKSMLDLHNYSSETIYRTSCRPRVDSNMSLMNSEPQEVAAHLVKFAKDSSKYWYKPNLSREEVVQLLLNAEPGTFIVRNSTTYKDNYGLVVRVHQPPPNSELTGQPDDLVRHFLIEPTKHGVRLKSCANEPVFTSLSALIYEHSINKLALPCLLRIPEHDLVQSLIEPTSAQKQLLTQGAACNVLWLYSCDTESLTGAEAIRKAIRQLYAQKVLPSPTEVHFKVTQQGITLTDNTRKKFFRKHYPGDSISFCAIDPDHRLWSMQLTEDDGNGKNANNNSTSVGALKKTIFAFVARSSPKSKDNQCHVFCDLDIHQPASAIVSFANKTLPTEKERNFVL